MNSKVFKCFNLTGQRLGFLLLLDKWLLGDGQVNLKAFRKMLNRILIRQVWEEEEGERGEKSLRSYARVFSPISPMIYL